MKVILKKVRQKTWFTRLSPIICEPLELEYLQSALDGLVECEIVDPQFGDEISCADIYVLNGYNTARELLIKEATHLKQVYPETVIIASGVDVQLNADLYKVDAIDFIYFSTSLAEFRHLIEAIINGDVTFYNCYYKVDGLLTKSETLSLSTFENIIPNRMYLEGVIHKSRYLEYQRVALVKNSIGCRYNCSFCYCKNLNEGNYYERDFSYLFEEMKSIDADYFWIVDDVLVNSLEDLMDFCDTAESYSQEFSIICYLRSDIILKCSQLLHRLRDIGVKEVIVGFESVNNSRLDDYNKGYDGDVNQRTCEVLSSVGLSYTALFMVHPDDSIEDFSALRYFIKKNKIPLYTFSIFTPLRGTDIYDVCKNRIVDFNSANYDFLHLVMNTTKMSSFRFKWEFVKLHIFQFFNSKRSRRILLRRLLEKQYE